MTTTSPPSVTGAPLIGALTSYVKRTVRARIEDSTERVRSGAAVFRPEAVALVWLRDGGQPCRLTRAELFGHRWKSDGTVGKTTARRDFAGAGGGQPVADAPAWLTELVERHGPGVAE